MQHVDAADLVVRGAAHLLVCERHVQPAPRVPRGARRAPRAGPLGPRVRRRPLRQTGASSTPLPASASSSPPPAFSCVLVVLHSTSLDSTRLLSLSLSSRFPAATCTCTLECWRVRHLCRSQIALSTEHACNCEPRGSSLRPARVLAVGLVCLQFSTLQKVARGLRLEHKWCPHAHPSEQTPG